MTRSRASRLAALLAVLLLASCSGPQLLMLDRPVSETKTSRALTNSTALEDGTRATLRSEDLLDLYKHDPGQAIRALAGRFQEQPSEPRRLALAEICSDQADRLTEEHPVTALGHYLDAAHLTEKAALTAVGREGESLDRTIYNYCAMRVTRLIHDRSESRKNSINAPGSLQNWRISLAQGPGMVDPRRYDIVTPASWLKAKGIKWEHITQDGFGAAMIAYVKATPERLEKDPMTPPGGRGTPLNTTFRFAGNSATLVVQNLMDGAEATVRGRAIPLAADFSAALAFTYYDETKQVNKMAAFLRPEAFVDMIGLYSLEPFREDKIPLILVHGLMSTAEGWLPFVNLLLADPVVRERYQILLFNYPTGFPIGENAAELRDALARFQQTHDPGRRNPRMREMVILGHSMGGIISNMQIRDSGDRLYESFFTKDLEDLSLDTTQKQEIRRIGFFKANPDIDRALLLASPLRGSSFATNKVGRFGAWLIRMPFNMVDAVLGDVELIDAMTDVAQQASQRPHNSVSGLRPDNPLLHSLLECPVRSGVPIHSIVAVKNPQDPLVESTDGVVPYTSAHLDEAVSEKVIMNANHRSMVTRDETIGEILRILYLHAGVKRR